MCGDVRGGVKECRGQEARKQADAAASGPPSRCWRRPSSKAASSISNLSPHLCSRGCCTSRGLPSQVSAAPKRPRTLQRMDRSPSSTDGPVPRPVWPAPPEAISGHRQVCRADPTGLTPSCVSPRRSPRLSPLFPAHLASGHLPRLSTSQVPRGPCLCQLTRNLPRTHHGAAEAPCLCRAHRPTSRRGCGPAAGCRQDDR